MIAKVELVGGQREVISRAIVMRGLGMRSSCGLSDYVIQVRGLALLSRCPKGCGECVDGVEKEVATGIADDDQELP